MTTLTTAQASLTTAFTKIKLLVGGYLAVNTAALAVIIADHTKDTSVWVHGIIVAASAVALFAITRRAAKGSSNAFLRLRIVSAVLVAAIAVTVAIPGSFPLWMKAEQTLGGLLLIAVTAIANSRTIRTHFTKA